MIEVVVPRLAMNSVQSIIAKDLLNIMNGLSLSMTSLLPELDAISLPDMVHEKENLTSMHYTFILQAIRTGN